LKPFFSIVANVIATVAAIVLANPATPKGLFFMIGSVINSFALWFYDKVADIAQTDFKVPQEWQDTSDSNLPGE